MTHTKQESRPIVRTERGLCIAGTRTTLYSVMDYVATNAPAEMIRDRLGLTEQQVEDALDYIAAHREEVNAEYQLVLENARESRNYWAERNRTLFEKLGIGDEPRSREELREELHSRRRKNARLS